MNAFRRTLFDATSTTLASIFGSAFLLIEGLRMRERLEGIAFVAATLAFITVFAVPAG